MGCELLSRYPGKEIGMPALTHQQIIEQRQKSSTAPTFREPQIFVPPKLDVGRIRQLTQEQAAPALRRERFGTIQGLQAARSEGGRRGNPLAGLLRRQVLGARGQNIADIMAGAQRQAQAIAGPEFAATQRGRELEFQAGEARAQAEFQAGREDFRRSELLRREEERRPTRQPTRFVRSTGFGGGTTGGGFSGTSAAIRHFVGGGGGAEGAQASSQVFWKSDDDQRAAMIESERTGRPLSDFYTGSIVQTKQREADTSFRSQFGL